MNDKIYQEELLEYYKHPQYKQVISSPDFQQKESNPSCGDQIEITGTLENKLIATIGFQGKGCVISQATAAMLTEFVIGKTVEEVLAMTSANVTALIKIELGPVRLKCALLALQTLQAALQQQRSS